MLHRPQIALAAAAVAILGCALAPTATGSSAAARIFCPRGHQLIHHDTHWQRHRLAPGVSVSDATLTANGGKVQVHVIRADLNRPGVALQSLHGALDTVHPLTALAADRSVVAATNGMYFAMPDGPPIVPFADGAGSFVMSRSHSPVVGVGADGRLESGSVSLDAKLFMADGREGINAVNQAKPSHGLTVYTAAWGNRAVPLGAGTRSRELRRGRFGPVGRRKHVVAGGVLLVAKGARPLNWMHSVPTGAPVALGLLLHSTAAVPFHQFYGVGTHLVAEPHHVLRNLYCRSGALLVPRTAIGWDDGGRQLLLAVVSTVGRDDSGLDENQMSYLMSELGAEQAYALDGGGSSEMVARMRSRAAPQVVAGGPHQRRIPVGLGVTVCRSSNCDPTAAQ